MDFYDLKDIRKGRPLIAAHRGTIGVNLPCNTLEAFDVAIMQGADIVELDVTKSIDGELFVFHPFMDFAHLGKIIPMQLKHSKCIRKFHYRNLDFTKTQYLVSTLDDALDHLKGRCVINVDKFWSAPKSIVEKLKKHNMIDSVIVKSYYNDKVAKFLSQNDAKIPYMLMTRKVDANVDHSLKEKGVNLVAEELIFDSVNSNLIACENLERLTCLNLMSWVNTIVYDYKANISGGLTDDRAVVSNPSDVWGYLRDIGVDIIQTDWVRELSLYLRQDNQKV